MKITKHNTDINTLEIAESLLFLGNGFIGSRNILDEYEYDNYKSNRHTYVNGFYDTYNITYPEDYFGSSKTGEMMIPVIDGSTTEIYLDDENINMNTCEVLNHERYLDIKKGISIRKVLYKTKKGYDIEVKTTKLISFVHKNQYLTKYEFNQINNNLEISLKTSINLTNKNNIDKSDPRVGQHKTSINIVNFLKKHQAIEFEAPNSKINCFFKWKMSNQKKVKVLDDKIIIYSKVNNNTFTKGYSYSLTKFIDVNLEFDQLYHLQQNYLDDFWDIAYVKIDAADELEQTVNYGTYCLLQSVGQDGNTSISAKGLSGIGYEGHVFWDAEMYVFPMFLKISPSIAKKMLLYRINMLDKAIENRKKVGYEKGALYPWRTISGCESSSFFEAGMAQHHINLDICYAILEYLKMTNDYELLYIGGWSVLVEIITMFESLIHLREGTYHLDKVTGPDEYSALVDDNYYTNSLLKDVIKRTIEIYQRDKINISKNVGEYMLSENDIIRWMNIADNIFLPKNDELNILLQDRDFFNKGIWPIKNTKYPLLLNYHPLQIYRYQICKQADVVLALQLMFDKINDQDLIYNTIRYYDNITTHDSSLSFSSFATVYAKLNDQKAYAYFKKNARLDLDNIHLNTKDGIHTASMGGTYQTIVDGFLGMNIKNDTLNFRNNLPKEIKKIKLKVMYLNELYSIEASYNKKIIIKKVKGNNVQSSII